MTWRGSCANDYSPLTKGVYQNGKTITYVIA